MKESKFDFIGEDIISSSEKYEDIVSSSQGKKRKGKHYRKHKHGIAGFFQKIGIAISDYWHNLKKWQKQTIVTVSAVVLVCAVLLSAFFIIFDYNYNDITENHEELGVSEVIDEKIIIDALFGIDSRSTISFKGLSDSIMILSMNTETKKVKVVSVMRDSLVPIEYKGKTTYGKINSAYSKGGPELAIKTLNKCFGLDITEYATVNFYGMTDIIDAVGGIDVTLTRGEVTAHNNINVMIEEQCKHMKISPDKYYIRKSGDHHLNGVQAVAYARIRYAATINGTANDQGRTERQRYVMEQLFNKATTLTKSQYVNLAKSLIPCSETSLSYSEIINLATDILLKSPTFEQSRIPLDKYQMRSISVKGAGSCVYYDLDYAGKVLRAFIYDDIAPEDYMEQYGIEKNNWYKGSGSSSGSSKPQSSSASSSNSSSITSSDVSGSVDSSGENTSGEENGESGSSDSSGSSSESSPSEGGESSGDGSSSSSSDADSSSEAETPPTSSTESTDSTVSP